MKTYIFEHTGNSDIQVLIQAENILIASEILVRIVLDSYKFEYKP